MKDIIVTLAGIALVCLILLNIVFGNSNDRIQKQLKDIGIKMKDTLINNTP